MTISLRRRLTALVTVNSAALFLAASWLGALPRVAPVAGAWQSTAVLAATGGVWAGIRLSGTRASRVVGERMSVAALALALPWMACASNAVGLSITLAFSGVAFGAMLRSRRFSLLPALIGGAWGLIAVFIGIDVELSQMIASGAALGILAWTFRAGRPAPVPLNSRGESR